MAQQQHIHWIDYICLLPFVALLGNALIADDWFTRTGIGKHIGFYIAMAGVPLATAVSYRRNQKSVKFHPADYFVLFWLMASFGFSYLYFQTVNNKMATLVMLGALYYCFRIFSVQNQINLRMLVLVAMLAGCAEAVWGLLQLYGFARSQHALFRVTGSFFNPGPYAGFLAAILPVALFHLCWDRPALGTHRQRNVVFFRIRWGVSLITCIAIVLILPSTMSRAAWIASVIGCATVLWGYYWCFLRPKGRRKAIGRAIAIVVLLFAFVSFAVVGLYYLKKDSADGRALIWKLSIKMASKTWYGEGLGRFSGGYGAAQHDYFESGRGTAKEQLLAGEPEYAFNEFVQIAAEQGFVPLFLFLLTIVFAFITAMRHRRFAAAGGLAALSTFALFSYPFSLLPFLIVFIFLLTSCISIPYQFTYFGDFLQDNEISYRVRRKWNAGVIVAVLAVSILLVTQISYKRYPVFKAHEAWGRSRLYYQTGMYERVAQEYRPLHPYMRDQPHFLFEYGRSLYQIGAYKRSIDVLSHGAKVSADPMFHILIGRNMEKQGQEYLAEANYRYAANMAPNRVYPLYLLAKLYDETGGDEKAYRTAVEVVEKEIKISSPAVEEMKEEMKKLIQQEKHKVTSHDISIEK